MYIVFCKIKKVIDSMQLISNMLKCNIFMHSFVSKSIHFRSSKQNKYSTRNKITNMNKRNQKLNFPIPESRLINF